MTTDQAHWRQFSKCKDMDPDMFFPGLGSSLPARNVCNGEDGRPECPVKAQCLDFALAMEEANCIRFGVYGGMSSRRRTVEFTRADRKRAARPHDKCANGHEYTLENTLTVNGRRRCLSCRMDRARAAAEKLGNPPYESRVCGYCNRDYLYPVYGHEVCNDCDIEEEGA